MGEILAVLLALASVLFILAAIGHGIWLLVAAMVRALFSKPESDPSRPPGPVRSQHRFCRTCNTDVRLDHDGRCSQCGLVGCYADWKKDFNGYQKLMAMM